MSTVSASDVKTLRDMTSAGYGDCRKALVEANGNIDEAVKILRTQGRAKAEKKQGRVTSEGVVQFAISDDKKAWAFVEVNCETDFVAREATFVDFVQAILETVLKTKATSLNALENERVQGFATLEAARENLVLKVGENVQIARVSYHDCAHGFAFGYQHSAKLAVVVAMNQDDAQLGKEVAIHIAAMQPIAVKSDDLPQELLASERAIYEAQLEHSGKPKDIKDKIIEGKMRKFSAGMCLYGQDYVKDPSLTVEKFLQANKVGVEAFERFSLGEK